MPRERVELIDSTGESLSTTQISTEPVLDVNIAGGTISFTPSGTQDVNLTKVGGTAFALGQQLGSASIPIVLTAAQITTLTPLSTVAVTQSTSPWVSNVTQFGGSAFSLGQQLSAASLPVVLTAAQITTLTPLSTVAVTQSTSPWVTSASQSGTWNIGTLTSITNTVTVAGAKTNNNAAPGSTNIGTLGALANASTPSWTEGNQVALSVDLSGNLRTSASITPTADSAPATQNITAQDTGSSTSTGANSQSFVTGSPTAGSAASFSISSYDTLKVQVTGVWTGTLAVEHSYDSGTTWVTSGLHQDGTAFTAGNFTSNFIGGKNVSGATNVRVRATATWTGTATVKIIASVNPHSIYIANGLNIQDATTPSQKLQITSSGEAKVAGTKTNNNATPGATNLGVLGAIANTLSPSFTEGNQVGLSVDLSGNLRTTNSTAQNVLIIDILAELLRETRALRIAMSAWTSEAVAGYNISDFDPHNIQTRLQ